MKVLILGSNGMIGSSLVQACSKVKGVDLHPWTRKEADVTNIRETKYKIFELKPNIISNATGFANIEQTENNKDLAFAVNGDAVRFLAELAVDVNAVLVHFSSDQVFDGNENQGYPENYPRLKPINSYGFSKALGETGISKIQKIVDSGKLKYYLVRTSWVYGKYGDNFVNNIINLSQVQSNVPVNNDIIVKPTYNFDLAKQVFNLFKEKRPYGIYHIINEGSCSLFEFAQSILKYKNLSLKNIKPIKFDENNALVKYPLNSILLNTKLPPLRHWQDALKDFLQVTDEPLFNDNVTKNIEDFPW